MLAVGGEIIAAVGVGASYLMGGMIANEPEAGSNLNDKLSTLKSILVKSGQHRAIWLAQGPVVKCRLKGYISAMGLSYVIEHSISDHANS